MRLACDRYLKDLKTGWKRGLIFDEAAADQVIKFFTYLRHFKGKWKGMEFRLEPWQAFIVGCLFGWKRADGTRRFRKSYVRVARKNGKTMMAAGIILYMLLMDGEEGAEIYSGATKHAQAKIVWDMAALMVKNSPSLRGRVAVYGNPLKDGPANMNVEATSSKFEPVCAEVSSQDGLEPHCFVLDEVHEITRKLYDVLKDGAVNRSQPLGFLITTAGFNLDSFCVETDDYCKAVLQDIHDDDEQFSFIAEIDDDDDWQDSSCYGKANPNLGVSVNLEELKTAAKSAAAIPSEWVNFMTKRLNRFTQQAEVWIPLPLWDSNAQDDNGNPLIVDEEKLAGRICYGSLDLSQSQDLTAECLVFPRDDDLEMLDILWRFWIIKARLTDPKNKHRDLYQAWEKAGLLVAIDRPAIDYEVIVTQVLEDAAKFNLVDANVDRLFQGNQTALRLQEEGIEIAPFGQGYLSFTAPSVEFERLCLLRKLNHGGHPMLRWMINNLGVEQRKKGSERSLKPAKKNEAAKIDGIVTLIMAIDRAMRHQKSNPYKDGVMAF